MTSSQPSLSSRRRDIAQNLPILVAFLFLILWLPERSLIGRFLESIVGAVAFYVIGALATLLSTYIIARVGGMSDQSETFIRNDFRLAGSILLFVFMFILGQHWSSQRVRDISRCVDQTDTPSAVFSATGTRPTVGELVKWCDEEYGKLLPADDE